MVHNKKSSQISAKKFQVELNNGIEPKSIEPSVINLRLSDIILNFFSSREALIWYKKAIARIRKIE
jgi:hypothetical protein